MHISTVRIRSVETASGFIVINEADFDPSKHQLWNSEVTAATPEPSSAEPNANKPLDLMTLAELRDHAKAHGIAIPATITAKADVLAHVLAASPGKWLLSELTRGYKGTTAASGASGAAVSLKSRAFVQALCRPNVSAWIVIDKTLQAVQGCHVTDASISVTKEGAVELTGTLTGCRVFNAGPSSVAAEAQTSATSITVEDAKMFFVGQKIQNTTKSDDNSGKGYAVTAVDERTNTLTVAPGISGAWAVDDVVTWWMPYGPAIGNELENADSVIRIDGTAGKMRSYTIKFSTPTEFTDELGDRFPGQPIDTMRASSVDFEYYCATTPPNGSGKAARARKSGSTRNSAARKAARSSWPAPASRTRCPPSTPIPRPSPFRNPPTSSAWHSKTPWKSSSNSSGSRRLLFRRGHSPRTTSTFNQRINIMKFVNEATAKDTVFIKCFPDDSGVYARVLTETELDTLRVKSRTFNGNEKRTPELMDRRFKILHLQRPLSGWEGLEFEDGSPIPFSKEMIKELWEVNPNLMGIIYSCVSSELSFVKAAEEKNSVTGADA